MTTTLRPLNPTEARRLERRGMLELGRQRSIGLESGATIVVRFDGDTFEYQNGELIKYVSVHATDRTP